MYMWVYFLFHQAVAKCQAVNVSGCRKGLWLSSCHYHFRANRVSVSRVCFQKQVILECQTTFVNRCATAFPVVTMNIAVYDWKKCLAVDSLPEAALSFYLYKRLLIIYLILLPHPNLLVSSIIRTSSIKTTCRTKVKQLFSLCSLCLFCHFQLGKRLVDFGSLSGGYKIAVTF